jgi:hypothetical protein
VRSVCIASALLIAVGCASLPPRYVAPLLPQDRTATVVTQGEGIGIVSVDGAIVCEAAAYSREGLKNASPGSSVRLAPGMHEVTFACWNASVNLKASTNVLVEAGARYRATRSFRGYSFALAVEREQ